VKDHPLSTTRDLLFITFPITYHIRGLSSHFRTSGSVTSARKHFYCYETIAEFHPEDGGSKVVRNIGILPLQYTVSQSRTPRLEFLPPWKPQISNTKFI